ncbi:MAG: hypothetical protein AB2A00_26055, partial [Myxococcota bacterium]
PARPAPADEAASTQLLELDEAARLAVAGPLALEEQATRLSSPGAVEAVRRRLAGADSEGVATMEMSLPAESDATQLGGPSFVEELRAQLAAGSAAAEDGDPFASSSVPGTVEEPDEEPRRDDPLDDPVIAAILAADAEEPAERRTSNIPMPRVAQAESPRPSVRSVADDIWGSDSSAGASPSNAEDIGLTLEPLEGEPGAAPADDENAHTTLAPRPSLDDLELPPATPAPDDGWTEGSPTREVRRGPAPRMLDTGMGDAPRGGDSVKASLQVGPDGRAVLKTNATGAPLRTHRLGKGDGKLLLAVPDGARITLDGAPLGEGRVLLLGVDPAARFTVEVMQPGCQAWKSVVTLGGKQTGQVKVDLKPAR